MGRRAVAVLVDLLVCYVVVEGVPLGVLVWLLPSIAEANTTLLFAGSLVALAPVSVVYGFYFELRYARTPGKVLTGLVVTTATGHPPGLVAAGVRNLLRYVDFLPAGYLLGAVVAGVSGDGRRVGDRLGGTLVVRPRASVRSEQVGSSADEESVERTHT
nr:RDD family protein [Halomarina oriensis]